MREIKFRAWLIETKEMIPVYEINFCDGFINSDKAWGMKREYILEQFTGIHDKNGGEIFEGDIVLVEGCHKGVIIFSEVDSAFGIGFDTSVRFLYHTCSEFLEVIGNIHDNPELIL